MLVGQKVILTQYTVELVQKYNQWLQDPELCEMTCTEPISLSEEYECQKEWANSKEKFIWIILSKESFQQLEGQENQVLYSMIGDINLFLQQDEEGKLIGEINVMIAEKHARGKGFAQEAIQMVIDFGISNLKCRGFIAKIKKSNVPSIKLFEKLRFNFVSEDKTFEENSYFYSVDSSTP